jgi:hypothetical protein
MEQGSFRNGIGCTTMLTTTIWEIQIRTLNMPVRFSEGPVSTLTLVGEEQDDPQRRQVRHFNSTNNTFTHSSAKSAEPLDTTICSSVFGRLPCLNSFLCFLCHFCRKKKKKKKFTSPLYPHFNNLSSIVKQSFILNHRTNACFSIASGNQINFHQTTSVCFDQISFHVSAFVYFPFFGIIHIGLSLTPISTLVTLPDSSFIFGISLLVSILACSLSRSLAFFCCSPQFRISILPASDASLNSILSFSS